MSIGDGPTVPIRPYRRRRPLLTAVAVALLVMTAVFAITCTIITLDAAFDIDRPCLLTEPCRPQGDDTTLLRETGR